MADLLQRGSSKLLDILQKISDAASPGANPDVDPALEEAAGPQGTLLARAAAKRAYGAARAGAVSNGARWYEMDAAAAPAAQQAYQGQLAGSLQTMDAIRDRRDKGQRREALTKMIEGITDPQMKAVAGAAPEAYAGAQIQDAMQSDKWVATPIGNGQALMTNGKGEHKIVGVEVAKKVQAKWVDLKDHQELVDSNTGDTIATRDNGIAPGTENTQALAQDKEIRQVRRQFDALDQVKNYRAVVPIIESAAKAPDTAPGDLDLIYAVGKILDPGSVVREGEMQLVIKSGSIMQQVLGSTRVNLSGKGRLDPERRKQLVEMLKGRVDALRAPYLQAREQYSGYATEDQYDPKRIVGEDPLAAFDQQPAAAAGGAVVKYVRDANGQLVRAQ